MKIIFGLGNIGEKYALTRHNAGFLALDAIHDYYNNEKISNWKLYPKLNSLILELEINKEKVLLVKPTTFMNLSGTAIKSVLNYYKADIEDILVIFDDIDLNFGEFRYKEKGSAGTHNGVKSIISQLSNEDFKRIKIGIENRSESEKIHIPLNSYVLQNFKNTESKELKNILNKAIDIINEKFFKPKSHLSLT